MKQKCLNGESQIMFVGGEFYYDGQWQTEKPSLSTQGMHFLNGGKACLTVIADYLHAHGVDKILLPTYLCPSIVSVLQTVSLQWDFYQINKDLSIDLDDLAQRSGDFRAVYFINYFGFSHSSEVRNFLITLQQKGVYVVEDNAQAGFSANPTGDFIFNSMRKLVPFDGGYLSTSHAVTPNIEKYHGLPNRRLPIIRAYRRQLYGYLFEGTGSYKALCDLYALAESSYASDTVVMGDADERHAIESLDWEEIRADRRENYQYLLGLINGIPEVTPLYPSLEAGIMPLGLPVYINDVSRDALYEYLGNNGIGLFIHWEELRHDPRTCINPLAVSMASRMLTLAIDQRTTRAQLDYQAEHLSKGIAKLRKEHKLLPIT